MIVISVDPGFAASGTAITLFEDGKVVQQKILRFQKERGKPTPEEKAYPMYRKLQSITSTILEYAVEGTHCKIVKEYNMMQGMAAEQHHQLEGALMLKFGGQFEKIHAMTVKKMITGIGSVKYPTAKKPTPEWPKGMPTNIKHKLEKARMALALGQQVSEEESKLIKWDDEDSVDSVCIGRAYLKKIGEIK